VDEKSYLETIYKVGNAIVTSWSGRETRESVDGKCFRREMFSSTRRKIRTDFTCRENGDIDDGVVGRLRSRPY